MKQHFVPGSGPVISAGALPFVFCGLLLALAPAALLAQSADDGFDPGASSNVYAIAIQSGWDGFDAKANGEMVDNLTLKSLISDGIIWLT